MCESECAGGRGDKKGGMPGALSPHRICFSKTHSAPMFHWASPIYLLHSTTSTMEEIRPQEGTGRRPPAGWVGGEVGEVTWAGSLVPLPTPASCELAPVAHVVPVAG